MFWHTVHITQKKVVNANNMSYEARQVRGQARVLFFFLKHTHTHYLHLEHPLCILTKVCVEQWMQKKGNQMMEKAGNAAESAKELEYEVTFQQD